MSRCRPCRPRREQVDRELLIAQISYWVPVLSDMELAAVASLAERLGRAAERLAEMEAFDGPLCICDPDDEGNSVLGC